MSDLAHDPHVRHPLQTTFAALNARDEYLTIIYGMPTGEGWFSPAMLAQPKSPLLAGLVSRMQQRLRTKVPNIIGSALLQSYQWPVIASAIGSYLLAGRVPDLRFDQVLIHLSSDGETNQIAYLSPSFMVLPSDPAAQYPQATVVANRQRLRDRLREALESHMAVAIAALCREIGCKPRGLWLNVADSIAGILPWLMQEYDKGVALEAVEAEVTQFIRVPASPLHTTKCHVYPLTNHEKTQMFLDRATCCYHYKTDGGEYCTTCPHRTPEDRRERLLHYMAEEYAGAVPVEA